MTLATAHTVSHLFPICRYTLSGTYRIFWYYFRHF